tara:strand:+ start:411 stop:1769 length:1359 start_codon:yes stop_codon:yes gene_type:complete
MNSYQFLIIGSGPGGTTVLKTLLENGLNDVAVVEEGQREQKTTMGSFDELINKYRYGGADIIYSKPNIAYAEGRTLGGGSEINSGLYHRIPENILSEWKQNFEIEELTPESMEEHYKFIEEWLNIKKSNGEPSLISKKLISGAIDENVICEEIPRWQSLKNTFYDKHKDINLYENTKVLKIFKEADHYKLKCKKISSNKIFYIKTLKLILSCGTFETPKLLKFSGFELKENTFSIHPHIKVGAKFNKEINDGEMVSPYQIKLPKYNSSLGSSINSKQWKALFLSENLEIFKNEILDIDKIGIFYNAIRPDGIGKIKYIKSLKTNILTYSFHKKDIENLMAGTKALIKLLYSAGAESVMLPTSKKIPLHRDGASDFSTNIFKSLAIHTVHTFSSMKLGNQLSNCDSFGLLNGEKDLMIADASILPGPPGVNPQGPLMALCRRNALNFIQNINK